jgi:hypothetical protein
MKPTNYFLKTTFILLFFQLTFTAFSLTPDNPVTRLSIKENTYQKLVLINTLSVSDLNLLKVNTQKGMFSELIIPNYGSTNVVGDPKLPVMKNLIEIPLGATVKVNIKNSTYVDLKVSSLGLSFPLMPAQPSLSKSDDPTKAEFKYNKASYLMNQFVAHDLATVETVGSMRGVIMGRLDISPIVYNPAKNMLRVYTSIEVEVIFENADEAGTLDLKARFNSPYFEPSFGKVLNYKQPTNKSNFTKYPVKYVIVADPMFQSQLQPFVQWKTKKGFTVIEAYTNNASVGSTTTSIKAYLQGLYNAATPSDPAPSFILFVGDIAQVPSFAGTTGSHVSDLYYCEYSGDFLPEVYYGRFSATSTGELKPQIEKTMEYEQYLMPTTTFLDSCVMIAGQDGTFGPTHGDGQINYGTDNYFNAAHGLYSNTYLYAVSGSSASAIIQNVSKGVCFANYTAHGGSDGWSSPSFSVSDIPGLHNAHKYPLMIGNCCVTNKFDEPACFGEALLRADGKGALGYIGGSNNTYWDEDYYWGVGYKSGIPLHPVYSATTLGAYDMTWHTHGELFGNWYVTQGQMVNAGNLAVTQSGNSSYSYYWEIYHLMGDPSLMIYYSQPDPMTVSYSSLMPLGSTTFNITTNAPYAYAAISMGGVLYGAALADSLGNIVVNLTPIGTPGNADVVVTCQNKQPYMGTVVVASPAGPYVLMTKNHVNGSDTLVDYNETNAIDVTLKNYGAASANGVNATISSTDPYLTITDNTQAWGTIAANASATQTSAYSITTTNFIPDQHMANFTLNITDNASNTWSSNLSLKINAPILAIGDFVIDDAAGNNNSAIDAGEAINIVIQSLNNGHSNAPLTTGTLSTTSPYVTITNGNYNFNTLNKLSSANASFPIIVSTSLPDTATIVFRYECKSGAYLVINYYYVSVGQAMEDFETNDFTKFDWQMGGNTPWIITGTAPYEGLYSAKSGDIDDGQTSELYVTLDVSSQDTISFWKKVSCEEYTGSGTTTWYDYMEFLIDGNSKDRWDGEDVNWSKAQYVVTPGAHVFKWIFQKDGSVSSGDDCAFLDYIIFPPAIKVEASIDEIADNNASLMCSPNPANGISHISFSINESENISLNLIDVTGKIVEKIIDNQNKKEGEYNILINMAKYPAGMYYLSLNTVNNVITEKIIIIK